MADRDYKVVPLRGHRALGPEGDVAFWRELAFRSEANGEPAAVSYWQAAIAAARLQSLRCADTELKWLLGRLARAIAVAKSEVDNQSLRHMH